jgi:hypothetical protein
MHRTQLHLVRTLGCGLALFFITSGCHPLPTRSDTIVQQLNTLQTDAAALYDGFNSAAYKDPLMRVGADVSLLLAAENERTNNERSYDQVRVIGVQVSKDSARRAAGPIPTDLLEKNKIKVLNLIDTAIQTENLKPTK